MIESEESLSRFREEGTVPGLRHQPGGKEENTDQGREQQGKGKRYGQEAESW